MRTLMIAVLSFFITYANAQIRGNQNIVTVDVPVQEFEILDIGLYADYKIDLQKAPSLTLTIDENLIEFVEKSVTDGVLNIDQLEWIKSDTMIKVSIGAKGMKKLIQTSHSRTIVQGIDQKTLHVIADVGDVILSGKVDDLKVNVGTADVNANDLIAGQGDFSFSSWGSLKASVLGEVNTENLNDGKLFINGNSMHETTKVSDAPIRFIKFMLRNNSVNRNHFYVEGPKPDGSSFSYGFPMMPFQKRDKDWTNGTRVYQVNNLGMRKLVKTISLDDEGEIVDIFPK